MFRIQNFGHDDLHYTEIRMNQKIHNYQNVRESIINGGLILLQGNQ